MAIAIDASSPIRFTGTPANNVDITSASFTPPANSVLVVCVSADTNGNSDNITISVSGGSLTWTNRVEHDPGDAGAMAGHASIWTPADGSTVAASAQTVSVRRTAGHGSTGRISVKIYVVTGADTADPTGATGEGHSTTNNITPNAYTSTVNNSRGFGCATDWNQLGTPTSSDTEDGADYSGAISVVSLHKAADTATSGSTVTMNFDAGGTGNAEWNWVALEIKPGAGGGGQTISPSGIATAEAFGTATLAPGAVAVAPNGIASLEAFGAPTLTTLTTIIANAIASAEAFGAPTLTTLTTIIANAIASLEAFGSHTLAPGAVLILPAGIASAEALGSPVISAGGSIVSPNGIETAETFGDQVLIPGGVNVSPNGIATAEAFGAPTLQAIYNVIAQSIASGEAFGDPSVNLGLLIIAPLGIASGEAFGVVVILGGGTPPALMIDYRGFAVSWIDRKSLAISWIDNRTIPVEWDDDETIDLG
jgi:hypothetical protein